jgi:hypothetical protein
MLGEGVDKDGDERGNDRVMICNKETVSCRIIQTIPRGEQLKFEFF